jgi:hypothetical protein
MSKTNATTPGNNKQDREQDKLNWALAKADLQAIAIRLDTVIKVGNETNLAVMKRVIGDLKHSTDNVAINLGIGETTAEAPAQ